MQANPRLVSVVTSEVAAPLFAGALVAFHGPLWPSGEVSPVQGDDTVLTAKQTTVVVLPVSPRCRTAVGTSWQGRHRLWESGRNSRTSCAAPNFRLRCCS